MMELFGWFANNWLMLVNVSLAVIGGASIAVRAIAPLTKSDKDDKAVAWLGKVHGWLSKLALNPMPKK